MRWRSRALLAALPMALGAATSPPVAPVQTKAGTPGLEEIVVTAQRRAERLRAVPLGISSFSSKRRDRLGIRTIQDYANQTPGLSYTTSLDRLSLRGIGRLTNRIGSDPGIATYTDGFYSAAVVEAAKTPMFTDRVEILRGPQGTLYGRNAIGGAINILSNRPTDYFRAEARTTIEQYTGIIAEGYVSGPLAPGLKTRLSVQMGPYGIDPAFRNAAGGRDEGTLNRSLFEGQLQYDAGDRTQIWLRYLHGSWADTFRSGNFVGNYATDQVSPAGAIVPNAAYGLTTPNPGARDPRSFLANTPSSQHLNNTHNLVANARTALGEADLKYVGGWSTYRYTQYSDMDNTPVSLVRTDAGTRFGPYTYNPSYVQQYIEDKTYWSNEVTLGNHEPGRLNWIAGLYQFHEDFYQPVTWFVDGPGDDTMSRALRQPINPYTFGPAAPNPLRAFYRGLAWLRTDSAAIFGQADYELRPRLKLTLGLRYSADIKDGTEAFRAITWQPTLPLPGCLGGGCGPFTPAIDISSLLAGTGNGSGPLWRQLRKTWAGPSARAALDWRDEAGNLLWVSYARGLKSGGFNLGAYSASPTVDQETADTFEIGTKRRLGTALTLDAIGFLTLYDNLQVPLFVTQGILPVQNFFNAPPVRSQGVELQAGWTPTPKTELSASYAFTDARFTGDTPRFQNDAARSAAPVSVKGNLVPQTSPHQVAVNALWETPVTRGTLFLAASYIYRAPAYYGIFQTDAYRVPGWNQVDLRATWVSPSRKLTTILYVRNLLDALGYDGVTPGTGSGSIGYGKVYTFTPPRSVGVEIQYRF